MKALRIICIAVALATCCQALATTSGRTHLSAGSAKYILPKDYWNTARNENWKMGTTGLYIKWDGPAGCHLTGSFNTRSGPYTSPSYWVSVDLEPGHYVLGYHDVQSGFDATKLEHGDVTISCEKLEASPTHGRLAFYYQGQYDGSFGIVLNQPPWLDPTNTRFYSADVYTTVHLNLEPGSPASELLVTGDTTHTKLNTSNEVTLTSDSGDTTTLKYAPESGKLNWDSNQHVASGEYTGTATLSIELP